MSDFRDVGPHVAKVHHDGRVHGYPPDVTYHAGCAYCGVGRGPMNEREAEMWKAGHDAAVGRHSVWHPLWIKRPT